MSKVVRNFDSAAKSYHDDRRKIIPCFDDFYGAAAEGLRMKKSRGVRFLDLGAGTGIMTDFALGQFPSARVTLLDLSANMLSQASARYFGNSQIDFALGDFLSIGDFPDASFDAIYSALAIHHVSDNRKRAIYLGAFKKLKKGGVFVNAEQVCSGVKDFKNLHAKKRLAIAKEIFSADKSKLDTMLGRLKLDRCSTVDSQLEMFKSAGFKERQCIYSMDDFAVLWARK